ncbi:hypothetical protein [Actinomycetospora sp. TBRC 11914]|uniref:hypothetical protein n=1 Tax=Actinomycetospora sp. TBRC 11914 TaxID=2729387 RepID=UPI00145D2C46|nr:hypothetical protein [Actinomycetospora sp. TBRC 11914]NMO88839.1 hypothetical protein [Actinomycetospora sp. TBRC 11914]
MTGGPWANAVRAEVGGQLVALGAHYGACRTGRDGTRSVSWWFPPGGRRRERRLVFRALGGRLDAWEVEYAELAAADHGRDSLVHASRAVRTDRDGLGPAVSQLLGTGLPARGRARRVPDDAGRDPVPTTPDGPLPGPHAARAAAAARRPPPPPRGVRVADGLLGVVVAVALLLACRVDIDLAPSIASFAVPLLGVSATWTVIGLVGAERRR